MKRKTKPTPSALSARKLIEACCTVSGQLAASRAIFECDPDGSTRYAERIADAFDNRRSTILASLVATPATTEETLYAKAKLVVALIDDKEDGSVSNSKHDIDRFIRGFADDAASYFKDKAHEHWRAAMQANGELRDVAKFPEIRGMAARS